MTKKPDTSATVFRALKILNHLKEVPGPQSIKKISEDLDISTTIIHRLLTTLKLEGFVFQDSQSKLYSLGSLFIEYANKIVTEFPFAPIIEPWLIELRNKTKETVGFYIPNGYSRLCVMEYESKEEIRRTVGVGTKHLIHEGATGRAILAFQSPKIQEEILKNLPIDESEKLKDKISEVEKQGYADSYEEINDNITAISAPVNDANCRVFGAIAIYGPDFRVDQSHTDQYINILINATKEIEEGFK